MINRAIVVEVDQMLDDNVSQVYKDQPLAQDWARVCKDIEEKSEAIAELILSTGQNPRKTMDPKAFERLLMELADRAMTSIYAIQHFTKDIDLTADIMLRAQWKHHNRLCPHANS